MKKVLTISCFFLVGIFVSPAKLEAQAFIEFSKLDDNGLTANYPWHVEVVDGETYTLSTSVNAIEESIGRLTKYGRNGSVLYSITFPQDSFYYYSAMKVINGEVYTVYSNGWENTSTLIKVNADGSLAYEKTFPLYFYMDEIQTVGNQMLLAGSVNDPDYPMTMGGTFPTGPYENGFIALLDMTTGEITRSMYTGFVTNAIRPVIENNAVYIFNNGWYNSPFQLPVTIGNIPSVEPQLYGYMYVEKLNLDDFSRVYARYISPGAESLLSGFQVHNGELYMTGQTLSPAFEVTNGSTISTGPSPLDGFFTKLNADGSIAFSTYLSLPGFRLYPRKIEVSNGHTYIVGEGGNIVDPNNGEAFIYKFAPNGSTVYLKQFDVPHPWSDSYEKLFEVVNNELYIAGFGAGPNYPVTNGTHYEGDHTGHYTHLDASGNIIFSSFLGRMSLDGLHAKLINNKVYLVGSTESGNHPPTDGSVWAGGYDNYIVVLDADGSNITSSYIGGSGYDIPIEADIDTSGIYLFGATQSLNYPLTQNVLLQTDGDSYLTKISFCPGNYKTNNDTLFPKTQTVCKYGIANIIHGQEIILPGDSLPTIYHNGIAGLQHDIGGATYQWQKAPAPGGPWTNIASAISRDYTPVVANADQYYRRQTFMPPGCGSAFIHNSDTAAVLVNTLTAPTLDAGTNLFTCPSSPIAIGGTPTATGGNPPYISYTWDNGVDPVANPTVSPAFNTIYTLVVTDAAGCQQLAQTIVLVYKANAGPDKSNCAGTPVKIGSTPIAGVPAVVYTWQPATDLSATDIAQPFANPSIQTDYDITITLPRPDGTTCITHDTVKVTPVAGPLANFAGPDKTTCNGTNVSIGTAAQPGFTYTWSPSGYLTNINSSSTAYSFYGMPVFDPIVYQLTAYKNGCYFTDQVIVSVIKSDAGSKDCGPRLVGMPDETPYINETYSWVKISGTGNFTGPTNLPQVPVSASPTDSTTYGLTVSYNGTSCYSEVIVPSVCPTGCGIIINVDAPHVCPSYALNNGNVRLIVSSLFVSNAVYSWEPQQGLSNYTSSMVELTDNVTRTYTVTVTDAHDSTIHCSDTIHVNDPSLVLPVFPARDTVTCAGVPVMIGLPPVAGYTYWWEDGNGLSNTIISNPIATINASENYSVLVTNIVGCVINEDVFVDVQNTAANAGEDWMVCSNAVVTLGTQQWPNTMYLWEPQSASWQNGTGQFSAQPQVLTATTATYTLTTTTTAGCVTTDEVNITVNNTPTIDDAPDVSTCLGYGTGIGSPALPGVSYQWTPAAGLDDPTAAQPYASPTTNTVYTVIATFPGDCALPATDQVTVTVKDPSFNMPDIHFCPGDGAVNIGVNAPAGMGLYVWHPTEIITNPFIANPATPDPPPNSTTSFTLFVYNNGCSYEDTMDIIPFVDLPMAGADRTACKDQPVHIGSTANVIAPSISYNWTPGTYLDDSSDPNPLFTGTVNGTYQYVLKKTDNSISCSTSDTVMITVVDILPPLPSPNVCRNSCVQIGTITIPGINYQWAPATGLSDPSISNPLACIDTTAATYTLTANDQQGCIISSGVVIGVNTIPGLQASVPAVIACIGDNNVMFNPSVPPGSYSYLWAPGNGTLSNINIANPLIQISNPGTSSYSLQITDAATGCTNTLTAIVTMNTCSPYGDAGNFMWFDINENGIQDIGELGVSGATVRLYNSIGFNIATTVTDANGSYTFNDIPPGNDYYIIFQKPAGYEFTIQNAGGITASDNSKADATGRTNNFNLVTGSVINNMDAGIKPGQIVPVTLLSFTAMLQNNKTVLLNWQTTAEINNHYFDVQRSDDGISFNSIGNVNGHGTTLLPHSYSLIDTHPLDGFNYYRLRQVDFDGHFIYSNVQVVELKNNETVTAWYNNQNHSIQLRFNNNQTQLDLKLFGSNGQLVISASSANNMNAYNMNLPMLSTGVYMLQVIGDKLRYSKKIFISQ